MSGHKSNTASIDTSPPEYWNLIQTCLWIWKREDGETDVKERRGKQGTHLQEWMKLPDFHTAYHLLSKALTNGKVHSFGWDRNQNYYPGSWEKIASPEWKVLQLAEVYGSAIEAWDQESLNRAKKSQFITGSLQDAKTTFKNLPRPKYSAIRFLKSEIIQNWPNGEVVPKAHRPNIERQNATAALKVLYPPDGDPQDAKGISVLVGVNEILKHKGQKAISLKTVRRAIEDIKSQSGRKLN